jgi:proline racemase
MESTEYPPMSGSNTICTVTAILETGILPIREPRRGSPSSRRPG